MRTSTAYSVEDVAPDNCRAPIITPAVAAQAKNYEVAFFVESDTVVDLASRSESGNWFGIQVDTFDLSETGYVKVSLIDGSAELGW